MERDEMWASALMRNLPSVPVTPELQARILADYDRTPKRRGWTARLAEAVWPGAPLWRPAGALALALAVGAVVGSYMPLGEAAEHTPVIALDEAPSFDLGETS